MKTPCVVKQAVHAFSLILCVMLIIIISRVPLFRERERERERQADREVN